MEQARPNKVETPGRARHWSRAQNPRQDRMPHIEAAANRRHAAPPQSEAPSTDRSPPPSAILLLHRLARRLRLAPPEFGRDAPVDESDPQAVRAEWRRYFRLWADQAPDEIFALKLGATLLSAALVALACAVALLS
jgi:hypothetical protein